MDMIGDVFAPGLHSLEPLSERVCVDLDVHVGLSESVLLQGRGSFQ